MKTTMTKRILAMAIGPVVLGSALAGDLEPPGPPAPTMFTLQQIYHKWGLPKTGQTVCYDALGGAVGCVGTGQDGAYQAGVSVGPRFTNNNDGTVKDNLTGLTWLRNANCFGAQNWMAALFSSNSLASGTCGLTDGSAAGAWRLPNLRELQSLIDYQNTTPNALPSGHPFSGVQSDHYWSSTSYASAADAWIVFVGNGDVNSNNKLNTTHYVWPVRGGQ